MERKQYFQTIATTGLIMALLCSIPSWANWIFNSTINPYVTFVYQLLAIGSVLVVYGKRVAQAEATDNGYLFGQAFKFAIFVSMAAGIVSGILSWLLTNIVAPEIAATAISAAQDSVEATGASENVMETAMSTARFMISFPGLLIINLLSMVFSGGIVGLITSAIVQRKPQI